MQNTYSHISSKWVLPLTLLALVLPIALLEIWILNDTGGVFCYGADDPFTHLAIAKNLAFHGVWGTTPDQFVSASSSVLYPLLIAGVMKLTGPAATIPFFLCLVSAILSLFVVQKWLKKEGLNADNQFLVLLALIFFTPLPIMVMVGMEHILQLLLCFLFITSFSEVLATPESSASTSRTLPWMAFLYGALMVACRYECAIFVLMTAAILLYQRRIKLAFWLVFFALMPILLFGIYSVSHGSLFFPNSVLLKSKAPPLTFDGLFDFFTSQLYQRLVTVTGAHIYNTAAVQRLMVMLPLMYFLFSKQVRQQPAYRYIILLLTGGLLAHLAFATIDRTSRYEAYVVGLSAFFIIFLILKFGREIWYPLSATVKWASGFIAFILVFPLVFRAGGAFVDIKQASVNIFDQQYQMGSFFHRYYNNDGIALNDIGAVSYLTEGKKLDLIGLASNDVAKARLHMNYSPQVVSQAVDRDNVKVAVIFNIWFPPQFYKNWTPVAAWTIPNNIICLDNTVTFYAVDTTLRQDLKNKLRQYENSLPKGVIATYF